MLFDLQSGKRRRVVQVVFGFLAFIFFISFVGFGIGSDVTGGIFDAIGLGGGSNSSDPQYEQQIEDAENTLETDPTNQQALLDLVRYHYLSATAEGGSTDPTTGQTSITDDANAELEQAAQAWTDYLKTDPKNTDLSTAANAAQVFVLLGDADGAAQAQAIVAEGQNTASAYGQLAFYYYAAGDLKQGDAAAKKAVEASDPTAAKEIEKNLANLRKQAIKQQEAIKEQAQQGGQEAGEAQLQDPFGGLGGASAAPVAPTP
jgi:tetratricopeptide (TPR) repeat protein